MYGQRLRAASNTCRNKRVSRKVLVHSSQLLVRPVAIDLRLIMSIQTSDRSKETRPEVELINTTDNSALLLNACMNNSMTVTIIYSNYLHVMKYTLKYHKIKL